MIPLWVGLGVVFLWLALLTALGRRKKVDGVRALEGPVRLQEIFDDEFYGKRERETPPRENARICNLSWFDDTIYLSDTDFSHCQFIRCKLIDDGGPFSMKDCFMDSCTIRSANAVEPQPANGSRGERQYNDKRPLTNRTRED